MSGLSKKLQRGLGVLLLAAGSLASVSCDEDGPGGGDGGSGNFLGGLAKQCGLECPAAGQGVLYGNASVSGYAPIDSFFRSVINYKTTAVGAAGQIDLELEGIKQLFGITTAELQGKTLGAAITAKIQAQADVVVKATPAQCKVDAKVAADVSAKCQAEAKCNINPGMASFNCMGKCEVEVQARAQCSAQATVQCEVTAPSFACKGECNGTCSAMVPTANCNAACTGACGGECVGGTKDGNGVYSGTCMGMCQAGCQITGMAALSCDGQCNGTCTYNPGAAECDASASVKCETTGSAAAMCTGSCDADFEPPSANCDASASCQASAKAEARFQVKCTPPKVEVSIKLKANATVTQAQLDFWVAELSARMPRISAAVGRAKVVNEAGEQLRTEGTSAVNATISAVGEGEVGFFTGAKIAACTPAGLRDSTTVIAEAKATLDASLTNATSVGTALGMLM